MTNMLGILMTPWGAYTHKFTDSFNHVVTRDHLTNWKCFISTNTVWSHQIQSCGDLGKESSTHKVTRPFNNVVSPDHVANVNGLSSLKWRPKAPNFGAWWTRVRRFCPQSLSKCLHEVTWQIKNLKYQLSQCPWPQSRE